MVNCLTWYRETSFKLDGLILGYLTLTFRALVANCLLLVMIIQYLCINYLQVTVELPSDNYDDYHVYRRLMNINLSDDVIVKIYAAFVVFLFGTFTSVCYVLGIHKKNSNFMGPYLLLDTIITFGFSIYAISFFNEMHSNLWYNIIVVGGFGE